MALVDCEVKETKIQFPFIYGYYCYDVEGKVLVDPVLRNQILKDRARPENRGARAGRATIGNVT